MKELIPPSLMAFHRACLTRGRGTNISRAKSDEWPRKTDWPRIPSVEADNIDEAGQHVEPMVGGPARYVVYVRHYSGDPTGDEGILATDDRERAQNRAENEGFRRNCVIRLEDCEEAEEWWEFSPTKGWSQHSAGDVGYDG